MSQNPKTPKRRAKAARSSREQFDLLYAKTDSNLSAAAKEAREVIRALSESSRAIKH